MWNTRLNHYGWKTYLVDIYGTDEVPAYAATARQSDYSNLPPAYTSVCTGEPFYCETLAFVENLRAAGVEVGLGALVYDDENGDWICPSLQGFTDYKENS